MLQKIIFGTNLEVGQRESLAHQKYMKLHF